MRHAGCPRIGRPLAVHMPICPERRERPQAESDFVTAMRGAAATIREVGQSYS